MGQVTGCRPIRLRVLIVEDSHVTRSILETLLSARHWVVCGEAETGRSGVQKFSQLHPDVVLLDLNLPDMSGLDVATQMRAADPTVPMILFTLFDLPGLERAAQRAGICAIVPKSRAWDLLSTIEHAIGWDSTSI